MPTRTTTTTTTSPFKTLKTRPTGLNAAQWAWDIRNAKSILNTSTKTAIRQKRAAMIAARQTCTPQQWAWHPLNATGIRATRA